MKAASKDARRWAAPCHGAPGRGQAEACNASGAVKGAGSSRVALQAAPPPLTPPPTRWALLGANSQRRSPKDAGQKALGRLGDPVIL